MLNYSFFSATPHFLLNQILTFFVPLLPITIQELRKMDQQITSRERFRAVFEHNTAGLDRLPMLSLGTPNQGLFYQEWEKTVAEEIPDEMVRLTFFGDKTMNKWLNSEWHNHGLGWGNGYPDVPYTDEREWSRFSPEERPNIRMNIGWNGAINAHGQKMHGVDYSWYVNGYFTRQKTVDGDILEPWQVREQFYAEHGEPWDDKFAPVEASRKEFQREHQWYEEHYNDFSESGFADFALMNSAGGIFEGTWEGMGSGTPGMSIMCRKYPGKLRDWLRQVTDFVMKSVKLQFELAQEVGAQLDFIWLWDDSGQKGRSLISPEYHREFWMPFYKEICDYVHQQNAFVIIHGCGFCEELLPNWIEAGIDAWQTIERAALNDPARIRENFGNKIILIGAVDASNVVSFAQTTGEVDAHVKQTMQDAVYATDDACYIPGFTHDLLDCPLQNVRTAVDAMLKYGQLDALKQMK